MELAILNLKQYCICCYVALSNIFNYFKIFSTVTLLDLQTGFKIVILYHFIFIKLIMIIQGIIICSAWFLDIIE